MVSPPPEVVSPPARGPSVGEPVAGGPVPPPTRGTPPAAGPGPAGGGISPAPAPQAAGASAVRASLVFCAAFTSVVAVLL